MRPRAWLPRNLGAAVATNIQQCSAHCIGSSCKPANINVWWAYRSEAGAYARHPVCPDNARLIQLKAGVCVGFDAGAFGTSHTSENMDTLKCDDRASTPAERCPAMLVLTRNHDRKVVRRFPPAEYSALSDSSTACAVKSIGIDADGTRFALIGEGRDCFGGTAYSLVEEIYVLRNGQPVLIKRNRKISDEPWRALGSVPVDSLSSPVRCPDRRVCRIAPEERLSLAPGAPPRSAEAFTQLTGDTDRKPLSKSN